MKKLAILALLTVLGSTFSGCMEEDPIAKSQINFSVDHVLSGDVLVPDQLVYHKASDDTFGISTLKYFLSTITLHRSNGDSVRLKDYLYVDGIDGSSEFTVDLANGTYNRLSLCFGIPASLNTTGIFNDPPENQMEWPISMGGGYHYMKMEGKYSNGSATGNYQLHTGPTAGTDYSIRFEFPLSINAEGSSHDIGLTFDLDHWLEDPNPLYIKDMTMIMGKAQIQAKLQENGVNVLRLTSAQ